MTSCVEKGKEERGDRAGIGEAIRTHDGICPFSVSSSCSQSFAKNELGSKLWKPPMCLCLEMVLFAS